MGKLQMQIPKEVCVRCGSGETVRRGYNYKSGIGRVPRFTCKVCGYTFNSRLFLSEKKLEEVKKNVKEKDSFTT